MTKNQKKALRKKKAKKKKLGAGLTEVAEESKETGMLSAENSPADAMFKVEGADSNGLLMDHYQDYDPKDRESRLEVAEEHNDKVLAVDT